MDYFASNYSISGVGCPKTNSMHILPPSPDSGQNSLEYWDYAVELEMLKGNSKVEDDLELAANLGKALLLANRKLETEVKENQIIIDEQSQEITYLTKQTSSLREANESRLKIYEQLDISVQDLEQANQRFKAESSADKKKIKSLLETVEQLETKCEQLQKQIDDTTQRGRPRNKSHAKDERYRRSISCENSLRITGLHDDDLRSRLEELESKFKDSQSQRLLEVRSREDLEVELACVTQDNQLLREQLAVFKEREDILKSIEEDFSSFDETSSGFCRKCNNLLETSSNHTMQDMDDIEEDDIDNIRGPCSVFRLRNGGFAYGSHESLASLGIMLNSEESSPSSVAHTESQPNSLFSELNVEYWSAMNKCEKLMKQRESQTSTASLNIATNYESCNRCATCTCDSRPDLRPKSILEEFSEVESASSGFSELNGKSFSKATQTEEPCDDVTPTVSYKPIVDNSDSASSSQGLPEYRKILHEVYYNIKQIVDHDKSTGFKPKTFELPKNVISEIPLAQEEDDSTKLESPEIVLAIDADKPKPQRPDFLEIEPRSVSRQKRRKRSKKPIIDVKRDITVTNENVSSLPPSENKQREISKPSVKHSSSPVQSPNGASSTRKDRSRRGCPHKIRSRNKRNEIRDPKPTIVGACSEMHKIAPPSVEVAKLLKLEMTYAQALKNPNISRRTTIRK